MRTRGFSRTSAYQCPFPPYSTRHWTASCAAAVEVNGMDEAAAAAATIAAVPRDGIFGNGIWNSSCDGRGRGGAEFHAADCAVCRIPRRIARNPAVTSLRTGSRAPVGVVLTARRTARSSATSGSRRVVVAGDTGGRLPRVGRRSKRARVRRVGRRRYPSTSCISASSRSISSGRMPSRSRIATSAARSRATTARCTFVAFEGAMPEIAQACA